MELYFRILERLSNHGIGEDVDITPEFDNYLLTFKHPGDTYGERIDKIREFLDVMKINKHLTYEDLSPPANKELSEDEKNEIRQSGEMRRYVWVKPIKLSAQITNLGIDYYYNHILKTATLKSLKSQEVTNRMITRNTTTQSKILRRQTCVFIAGAIFALGSVIFSGLTFLNDRKVEQLQSQLKQLK